MEFLQWRYSIVKSIIVVFFFTLLAVEYFLLVPFAERGKHLIFVAKKSVQLLASKRISDHWKEIVLLRYANELMMTTLVLFLMLLGLLLLMTIGAFTFDWIMGQEPRAMEVILNSWNWLIMALIASIYTYIRKYYV